MASGDGERERERAMRLALVPGVAYVAAATAGEVAVDGGPLVVLTIPVLAAGSAIFVAAPAFVALAAARHWLVRAVVLAVVTATAAVAGVLVTTSDDAQAGLAVPWVPYVALPLALAAWLGHAVVAARRRRSAPT
jgi:hypothetical protein